MKQVRFLLVAMMLAFSSMANAQSARSYITSFTRMLDRYCQEWYSEDFPNRFYQQGTLRITSEPDEMLDPLTGEFFLKGTHSYKGQSLSEHTNVKWEATLKQIGEGKWRITFNKWYEPDKVGPFTIREGHWEYGTTRDYKYGSGSSR